MKNFAITIAILLAITAPVMTASADEYVNGYTRQNGTHVDGYYRSDPNGTTSENYSHYGNTNPYTGQQGTRHDSDDGDQ